MPGRIARSIRAAITAGKVSTLSTVDNSTVELNGSTLRVKDGGLTTAKLGAAPKAALDAIVALPTSDQEDGETIWNDGGVLKVSTPA